MDTAIDTLAIEIESNGKEASGGIDSLIAKLENLKVKVNENLKAIGRLNSALIQLKANSSGVGKIGNIGKVGNVSSPTVTPTMGDVDTSNAVEELKKLTGASATASNVVSALANKYDVMGESGASNSNKVVSALNKIPDALKRIGTSAINSAGKGLKFLGSTGAKAIGGLSLKILGLGFNFKFGKKSMDDMGNSVNNLVKKLRMTTLALLGTRGAFTAIRKAVSEYMAYDTALAKTLQQDWAILGSLIAPILERIIGLFSTLVSYIATFIKMLTGVDLVAKANKKSLGGVGSSAGSTAKKVKELSDELGNLQKFDDLNVVDFPKDSGSSGGGGGGGAGAGGVSALKLPTVDTSALDALFDFIKRGDWYGLGMEIARKFNEGIAKIDFDAIEKKARQWAKNMGDLFNGLTDGIDWGLLGQQIGGGLNTMMGFVNTFFDTYNFDHLGKSLSGGFNSMVETIHWNDVGQFLANRIQAIFETLFNFVTGINWNAFGNAIATGINSWFETINWGMIASTLSKSIQGLLDTITTTFKNIDFGAIADDLSSMFNNLDLGGFAQSLGNSLVSIFNGLGEFLSQVDWQSLGQQIADFLINIDWGSLLLSVLEVVGNVMVGLGEILWGFLSTVLDFLWTKTLDFINSTPLGKSLTNMFKEAFEMVKTVWNGAKPFFKEIFEGIKVVFEPIGITLGGFFSSAWEGIKFVWNTATGFFKGIFDTIANIFSFVKSVLSGDFQGAWDAIKKIVSVWGKFFSDTWDGIKKVFSTVGKWFGDTFTGAWNAIKKAFSSVGSFFGGIFDTIKNTFKEVGTTVGNAIGKSFANVVNTIIGFAEKTINGFIKAINIAIEVINAIPGVKIKKLKELEIPKLATGTNKIEREGLYHLHQGEAVVPKKYNPAINNKVYSENNEKMLSKMDDLLEMLNNMETTNNVYIGNEKVHKSTVRYINREQNIYGTTVV